MARKVLKLIDASTGEMDALSAARRTGRTSSRDQAGATTGVAGNA